MYDVWVMHRTNIYLEANQIDLLRRLGRARGKPVANLVREAVDSWLESQGVERIEPEDWQARFDRLIQRRRQVSDRLAPDPGKVQSDVGAAVRQVRKAGAARSS